MARTVGVLKETFPGERCVAIVPRSVEALKKSDIAVIAGTVGRRRSRLHRRPVHRQGRDHGIPRRDFRASRYPHPVPQPGCESRSRPRRSSLVARGPDRDGTGRAAHGGSRSRGSCSRRRIVLRDGADSAHHARAEHGRAVVARDHFRLRSRAAGRPGASENFSDADDRRRHHHSRPRYSSSAQASPDCRPSPRRDAWDR